MLSEGKGGFINYAEYRESLTDVFWHGKQDEQHQVAAAQAAMGKVAPEDAMAELRRMHEEAVARSTKADE